jgi:16S rRNA (uracil1498-N3)-methyltransferase
MSYQLFYIEPVDKETAILNADETRHALKALRHVQGDTLFCVDGRGNLYETSILVIGKKECILKINKITPNFNNHPYHLHIGIAITRNPDRMEWFVEKATEIGINKITPIVTKRTEKIRVNNERLKKIALAAIKQSQKAYLPEISEPINLKEFIAKEQAVQKFIPHCYDDNSRLWLHQIAKPTTDTIIIIGPEGDFTEDEVALAVDNQYLPVKISPTILRTETAGIHCCQTISLVNLQ